MKRGRFVAVLALVAAGCLWGSIQPAHSGDRVTDDDIARILGKQHRIMQDQQQNLQALLGAFMNGDHEAIKHWAAIISNNMSAVAAEYPPEPRQQTGEWQSMVDISTHAGLLQTKAEAGLYDEAYDHFAVMTKRCVACHQVRRSWGVLTEPGDSASVDEAIKIKQKTTNFLKEKVQAPAAQPAQDEESKQQAN